MNYDLIVQKSNGGQIFQGDFVAFCQSPGQFDLAIMCAKEFPQVINSNFEQVEEEFKKTKTKVLFAPNDDGSLNIKQLRIASNAAKNVCLEYKKGKKVLVCCMQGRNRSGLVTALALHFTYGISGKAAAETIKFRRKGAQALTNENFYNFLNSIPRVPTKKIRKH